MSTNINKDAPIVILTGAGISAESGLPTFRASDGLWEGHRVEEVATPEAFVRNPALVHEFYNMRRQKLLSPEVEPNAAHRALGEFEERWLGDVLVVTQNIDDLHERGGSKNVIHMHGELLRAFCHFCGEKVECRTDLSTDDVCRSCAKASGVRPDIVWFGEMPYQMERILEAIENCALFISIGTSGNVYPAAGFVQTAKLVGAMAVELNLEPSQTASLFDQHLSGPATQVVPQFLQTLLD